MGRCRAAVPPGTPEKYREIKSKLKFLIEKNQYSAILDNFHNEE
jgi:hypothetical protein